ncbi:hypothetical protein [Mesobacillus boroniphilus]|uniref:hypothetical protein n=1 Tax=Mesobacillus boroniphilus TaxID=308892 RepID=UPI001BCE2C1F|nr:hypothetical protein [Mesobacillus boroniphilus]
MDKGGGIPPFYLFGGKRARLLLYEVVEAISIIGALFIRKLDILFTNHYGNHNQ